MSTNKWGGTRANSGRPTKEYEQLLIEDLDAVVDRKEAIRILWEQMQKGNMRAFSIYFDRRFGKAKHYEGLDEENNKFQIEVIDSRESLFKELAKKIKFE